MAFNHFAMCLPMIMFPLLPHPYSIDDILFFSVPMTDARLKCKKTVGKKSGYIGICVFHYSIDTKAFTLSFYAKCIDKNIYTHEARGKIAIVFAYDPHILVK